MPGAPGQDEAGAPAGVEPGGMMPGAPGQDEARAAAGVAPGGVMLDDVTAARLAGIALGHVEREYPHILSHAFEGPGDAAVPRALHPVFFGSFDWHSCVHGYWLLATVLRRFPDGARATEIAALFDRRLTAAGIAGECAYLARPASRGFERPYGWAWALALHHALRGTRWAAGVAPLADVMAARFRAFLPKAQYPVRVGTHYNTAFALTLSAPWAAVHDPALHGALLARALDWYGGDAGCQAWEPGQDEFLSPALMEAACMARLHPAGFAAWFRAFLPEVAAGRPATLFVPVSVSDRSDGKIAHLDGLNLSRAWCWRLIGAAPEAAAAHEAAGLAHVAGDFMGEHWLATFALLALWPGAID